MNANEDPSVPIGQSEYEAAFKNVDTAKVLESALAIRKFEIELYWKRAAYFWAFIVTAFVGYGVAYRTNTEGRTFLALIFSCLGLVFSAAWYLVNRGSKFWQENWENHVDLLEDEATGPLYKIVIERPPLNREINWRIRAWFFIKRVLTWPADYSVSKINQTVSLFIVFVWSTLVAHSIPCFWVLCDISAWWMIGTVSISSVIFVALLASPLCKTEHRCHEHLYARRRNVRIGGSRIVKSG